jgi:predicted metallopeptidase
LPKLRYEPAEDVCLAVRELVKLKVFAHIDPTRISCARSYGSRSRAVARIYGTPRAWIALGREPEYLIEVISERFYRLAPSERLKVIIHELLHIPKTFSGSLRPHGRYVNEKLVREIFNKALDEGVASRVFRAWKGITLS